MFPELAASRFAAVANNDRDCLACAAAKSGPNSSLATLRKNERPELIEFQLSRRFIFRIWRNQSFAQG
jgi:hypothetical protein